MTRAQGTVKWFSNQKGYGFVEPTSEGAVTKEDIFVHQSSVTSDGYRTLVEGWVVEFDIVTDESGKYKADNVTAPGGGPCTGPRRPRREKKTLGDGDAANAVGDVAPKSNGNSKKKPNSKSVNNKKKQDKPWHDILSEEVKTSLSAKGIKHSTGTVDVAVDKARIKLGTRGYVSMAHGDGILAEGTFVSDHKGFITFSWEHVLKFEGGAWVAGSKDDLMGTLSLKDAAVTTVGPSETPETLWGEGKPDPKDALEREGFQMRRVVLTAKVRSRNTE